MRETANDESTSRPGGAPPSPGGPSDPAPPRKAAYPPLPPHVLERLAGYIGPGLRNQMAKLHENELSPT